jgi:phospho-N-acetylmuramoyl-pentapeptide-transferase
MGLATVPVILVAVCFAFISYVAGNIIFSEYLQITYIEGTGEISIFLWSNNWFVFRIFMV